MPAKSLALALTRATGLQAMARHRCRDRLIVLCYHGVVSDDHAAAPYQYRNTVGASEFAAHLEVLQRRFRVVSADDVLAWVEGGAALPPHAVLITFDDGYRNNLTVAAPILRQHGMSALISVSTDYIGTDRMLWPMEVDLRLGTWAEGRIPMPDGSTIDRPGDPAAREQLAIEVRRTCKRMPDDARRAYVARLAEGRPLPLEARSDEELWRFMNWDEVRQAHAMGMHIASHTCSHPILSRLQPAQLEHELVASRRRIEQEVGTCPALVYPNGGPEDVSPEVLAAVERAGYRMAFTLMEQVNPARPHRHRIERIGIPGHVGMEPFLFRASGLRSMLAAMWHS